MEKGTFSPRHCRIFVGPGDARQADSVLLGRRRNIGPEAAHGKGVPAARFNLNDQERAMLADPDWVTEDDADAIVSKRRELEPGKNVSLEDALRKNGVRLGH